LIAREADGMGDVVVSLRREGGVEMRRTIVRIGDRYAVVDEARGGPATVRWNLCLMDLDDNMGSALVGSRPARVVLDRGVAARVLARDSNDPTTGWWSPTYGVLEPCLVVEVDVTPGAPVVARFAPADQELLPLATVEQRLAALSTP
jgi:hypothetical protein